MTVEIKVNDFIKTLNNAININKQGKENAYKDGINYLKTLSKSEIDVSELMEEGIKLVEDELDRLSI